MEITAVRNYEETSDVMAVKGDAGTSVLGMEGGLTGDKIPHGYVEMTFVKETATGRGRNRPARRRRGDGA